MTVEKVPWGSLLESASERVQLVTSAIALGGDRTKAVGKGASGDITLMADKAAEDELIKTVLAVGGVGVLSEEAGQRGDPRATTLAVLDPLDGSSNFQRGIPFYCTSVAIAEGRTLGKVTHGLVRNLVNGDVYWAEKGKGTKKNGKRVRANAGADTSSAVVEVDLSRGNPEMITGLAPLLGSVKRQVHFGANALGLCLLAEGRIDAFVDLRRKMRITDFAAGYLIATEAGARVTDEAGNRLNPGFTLDGRFSFIASANPRLHAKILRLCSGKPAGRER